MEAMQQSVAEALSNFEVAEKIWTVEANCFCADCGSPKPDWGSINLCVVICKRCAGMASVGSWEGPPGLVLSRTLAFLSEEFSEKLLPSSQAGCPPVFCRNDSCRIVTPRLSFATGCHLVSERVGERVQRHPPCWTRPSSGPPPDVLLPLPQLCAALLGVGHLFAI